MEKEASFWKQKGDFVQCLLCPHFCIIKEGETGKCRARQNINGRLISLVYNRPCSLAIDPIEKKPLYHFLPGEKTLSIATSGCNFSCKHCQNWEISQGNVEGLEMDAEQVVEEALKKRLKIISYTYTEPTIFYEYMTEIAKLARKAKIQNATVTNGFINPEPLKELCKHIDASNIDVKGNKEFYEDICGGKIEPVLEAIKIMHRNKIWIELTYLIIPGLNDSEKNLAKFSEWVGKTLGKDVPIHFTAFYPNYKMLNLQPASKEALIKARNIALAKGLNYVYNELEENTYCPACKSLLIERKLFSVIENKLIKGKCYNCKKDIPGVWH